MAALGLILIVIAVVLFLVGLLTAGNTTVTYDLGPFDVKASPGVVFGLGAVAMLALFLGLWMLRHAGKKARERRQERQRVEKLSRELDDVRRDDHNRGDDDRGDDRPVPI